MRTKVVVGVLLLVLVFGQCMANDLDFLTQKGQASLQRVIYAELTAPGVITSGPNYEKLLEAARLVFDAESMNHYRFILIKDPDINAYAGVGLDIFVNEGLVQKANDLDELAWVLYHENMHIANADLIDVLYERWRNERQFETAVKQATTLSEQDLRRAATAIGFGLWLKELKFSREAEYKADREATYKLMRIGRDGGAGVRFLQRLGEEAKLPTMIRTHPKTADRIKSVEQLLVNQPYFGKCTVVRDKKEFQPLIKGETSIPGYNVCSVSKKMDVFVISERPIEKEKKGIRVQGDRFWLVVVSPMPGLYWQLYGGWTISGDISLLTDYLTEDTSEPGNSNLLALELPRELMVRKKKGLVLSLYWIPDPGWKPGQEKDRDKVGYEEIECPVFLE